MAKTKTKENQKIIMIIIIIQNDDNNNDDIYQKGMKPLKNGSSRPL